MLNHSRLKRATETRSYKKLFIISAEGVKTERNYFMFFNRLELPIVVHVIKKQTGKSSPKQVLDQMVKHIGKKNQKLENDDEAWIVIDKDNWPEDQIKKIFAWEKKEEKHNVAISSPNFEYWLLLHFEDGSDVINNANSCLTQLRKHLPDYQKSIDMSKITLEDIKMAISRAESRYKNQTRDNSEICNTNVYVLVERILNS